MPVSEPNTQAVKDLEKSLNKLTITTKTTIPKCAAITMGGWEESDFKSWHIILFQKSSFTHTQNDVKCKDKK